MKYSESEIINALKVIKETCGEFEECKNCPLSVSTVVDIKCGLKYNRDGLSLTPEKWKIVGDIPRSLFLH